MVLRCASASRARGAPLLYCLITCNIKPLLNVPKISHISRKTSRFPDSRNKFVFLPKQPLLELSPPIASTRPYSFCQTSTDVTDIYVALPLCAHHLFFGWNVLGYFRLSIAVYDYPKQATRLNSTQDGLLVNP